MLNRDYTFVLENNLRIAVSYKNIDIKISPNIIINNFLINPAYFFTLNIRTIIELMMDSKIKSEHLGMINPNAEHMKEMKIDPYIKMKVKLEDITNDYVSDDFNKYVELSTDISKWLHIYYR